jgi:hypothetical protein
VEHGREAVVERGADLLAGLVTDIRLHRGVDRARAVYVGGDASAFELGGEVECVRFERAL